MQLCEGELVAQLGPSPQQASGYAFPPVLPDLLATTMLQELTELSAEENKHTCPCAVVGQSPNDC